MAGIAPQPAPVKPVGELAQQLTRQGWHRGVPPHLNDWARAVDEGLCRYAFCGNCKQRGLKYRPFFRGSRYKAVGECPACGHEEEF